MGTGNYRATDGHTVILDLYDGIFEEAGEDAELVQILSAEAFSDFRTELETLLDRTTFWPEGEIWRGRSERVLARNHLYEIWSVEDSYGHTFLSYGLRDDLEDSLRGMAEANLARFSERFFDRLQEIYPLRVATSAWTSGPREPAGLAQAA